MISSLSREIVLICRLLYIRNDPLPLKSVANRTRRAIAVRPRRWLVPTVLLMYVVPNIVRLGTWRVKTAGKSDLAGVEYLGIAPLALYK